MVSGNFTLRNVLLYDYTDSVSTSISDTYGTTAKSQIKNLNKQACFGVRDFYTFGLFDYAVLFYL